MARACRRHRTSLSRRHGCAHCAQGLRRQAMAVCELEGCVRFLVRTRTTCDLRSIRVVLRFDRRKHIASPRQRTPRRAFARRSANACGKRRPTGGGFLKCAKALDRIAIFAVFYANRFRYSVCKGLRAKTTTGPGLRGDIPPGRSSHASAFFLCAGTVVTAGDAEEPVFPPFTSHSLRSFQTAAFQACR